MSISLIAMAKDPPALPAGANQGSGGSKDAIDKGLHWLASRQKDSGQFIEEGDRPWNDVAFTALSGLALLSAEGEQGNDAYAKPVRAAIKAVLVSQQSSGLFEANGPRAGPMYGHGYATLFLAEAQRRHPDVAIKNSLVKSVELLQKSANPEGGWRYLPKPLDADVSVTACELNALLATRAAGIAVDDKLIEKAVQFVHRCQNRDGGFTYMLGYAGSSGLPRSAAGIAVLLHSGEKAAANADVRRGMDYLLRTPGIPSSPHYFYGSLYRSQCLSADPATRVQWDALIRELVDAQQPDGSWKEDIGPVYATASALIILQSPQKRLWIFGAKP
jgi:uncharacterized protein YfaS (alpha-2-macroglobulin family)